LYDNGLVRFCTEPYSTNKKSLKKRCTHLTNYSINKKSTAFVKNDDAEVDGKGDKWSVRYLRKYLQEQGIDDKLIWSRIRDLVVKTVIMSEQYVVSTMCRIGCPRTGCFELFGFDVLIDAMLNTWLMEVNLTFVRAHREKHRHQRTTNRIGQRWAFCGFFISHGYCDQGFYGY
jgi:tubulin polyglutamylase TTLL5